MKNKVLLGSIITTLLAFMLYTANLKRVENADLKIIGQDNKRVTNHQKSAAHEPHVAEFEYPNKIKHAPGSEKPWAKKIVQAMGKEQTYQVSVHDLNSTKFVQVGNTVKAHQVNLTSRLFVLTALYYQEERNKLTEKTVVKVKKSDSVKGEHILQPGIAYSLAYLKQAMMRGSKVAGNALVRKLKPSEINQILQKMGATHSQFSSKKSASLSSMTTADDLAKVMINLYHAKTLNRQYSNQVLGALTQPQPKNKLVHQTTGQTYSLGDGKSSVVLVQENGHAYCVSVWSNSNKNFAKLGKAVRNFFK